MFRFKLIPCVALALFANMRGVVGQETKDTLSQVLKEYRMESGAQYGFHSSFAGKELLTAKAIRSLPTFLGEADVLRALRLMPGVQSVSEGNSGVFVRGGTAGHNLFELDGMELLNPSHLMGLFSVFNPMTTGELIVYKGNAPAYLQGRLASTILVRSINPAQVGNQFEANVGTLSSSAAWSKISKSKNFQAVIGYRRSYLELLSMLAQPFIKAEQNYFKKNHYFFEDFNGKIRWNMTQKSRLDFSFYTGLDQFDYREGDLGYDARSTWGNHAATLQLEHTFNTSTSLQTSFSLTKTQSSLAGEMIENDIHFKSSLQKIQWKNKLEHRMENHVLHIGADLFHLKGIPLLMNMTLKDDTLSRSSKFDNAGLVFYAGDLFRSISGRMLWYVGLRTTATACLGPYSYGQLHYQQGQVAKVWWNVSPILSASYDVDEASSLKASFTINDQNIHLSSLSSIPLPYDIWMPSTPKLRPENSTQLAMGYHVSKSNWKGMVEVYGKYMRHQVIYNVVTDNTNSVGFEDQFFKGIGYAFGVDASFEKTWNQFSGKLRYSYARSFRSFPQIMKGDWFKDKNDRPHDFNMQVQYKCNDRWNFSALWTYASGNTMNLPTGRWWLSGMIMNDYSSFNAFRLPSYHRLDIAADLSLKSRRFMESVLNFSIQNVYNRANPYFAYMKVVMGDSRYDLSIKCKQISLFPIMPSLSWRFKI